MEFTKMRRGCRQCSGCVRRSGRDVRSKPFSKGMSGDATKALGEAFGVTKIAAAELSSSNQLQDSTSRPSIRFGSMLT